MRGLNEVLRYLKRVNVIDGIYSGLISDCLYHELVNYSYRSKFKLGVSFYLLNMYIF